MLENPRSIYCRRAATRWRGVRPILVKFLIRTVDFPEPVIPNTPTTRTISCATSKSLCFGAIAALELPAARAQSSWGKVGWRIDWCREGACRVRLEIAESGEETWLPKVSILKFSLLHDLRFTLHRSLQNRAPPGVPKAEQWAMESHQQNNNANIRLLTPCFKHIRACRFS